MNLFEEEQVSFSLFDEPEVPSIINDWETNNVEHSTPPVSKSVKKKINLNHGDNNNRQTHIDKIKAEIRHKQEQLEKKI